MRIEGRLLCSRDRGVPWPIIGQWSLHRESFPIWRRVGRYRVGRHDLFSRADAIHRHCHLRLLSDSQIAAEAFGARSGLIASAIMHAPQTRKIRDRPPPPPIYEWSLLLGMVPTC